MKFEITESWPDKSAEYKEIADAATKANADGKPGVKVTLHEDPDPLAENYVPVSATSLDAARAALRNQLQKYGRFDVIRDGMSAFVRVSTSAPRTRKAATKKAAAGAKK